MPFSEARPEIAIVDSTPLDYSELAIPAFELGVALRSFRTGRGALQAAAEYWPDLWMVGVRLPDMSGFEFIETLRSKSCPRCLFCIGDTYTVEDEIRARRLKVAAYVCKPVQPEWLNAWTSRAGRTALQASAP